MGGRLSFFIEVIEIPDNYSNQIWQGGISVSISVELNYFSFFQQT